MIIQNLEEVKYLISSNRLNRTITTTHKNEPKLSTFLYILAVRGALWLRKNFINKNSGPPYSNKLRKKFN